MGLLDWEKTEIESGCEDHINSRGRELSSGVYEGDVNEVHHTEGVGAAVSEEEIEVYKRLGD